MINAITANQREMAVDNYPRSIERLNNILRAVAAAYSDDPGTSDLDDEQTAYPVTGLTLGDVRLARSLVR